MRYLYFFLLAFCFVACTTNSNKTVVPVNTFSITFNGGTYNETSDASHPIVASVVNGRDMCNNNSILIAALSVNTKNITTSFQAEKIQTNTQLGAYTFGMALDTCKESCTFGLLDKGNGGVFYAMAAASAASNSTITINQDDVHVISGNFSINLLKIVIVHDTLTTIPVVKDSLIYDTTVVPATGSFTYNLYYGSH